MSEKSPLQKISVLYLDTSTPEATLAIFDLGDVGHPRKVAELTWEAGRELSKNLANKYEDILRQAKISSPKLGGICVFPGPGSFTGLRIGISFANGLSFALGVPIYEARRRGLIDLSSPKEVVLPFYGSEPNITKPKGQK